MTLLYPWALFFLIPLYFLYTQNSIKDKQKKRQKSLLYLSVLLTLLALSRPVITNTLQEQKFDAKDYIIALDASFSMQADDLQPSRYDVAKENISHIVHRLNKDRFSIFAFTTNAMLLSPPTTDTSISLQALNALEPKYILTKGTSLLALFQAIAKSSYRSKKLLIFSDGGEDTNLVKLVSICKKSNIIPYIIATASSNGATLKKENEPILDAKKNLVVSRINPLLSPLAKECNGKYYQLNSSKDISQEIIHDLQNRSESSKVTTKVLSYKELYYLPLVLALISFFLSVTKLHQLYVFIPLLLFPHPSHASGLFDFYKNDKAVSAYEKKNFLQSAKLFQAMHPSVASYYNSAIAYYKAGAYKSSMRLFSQIKTRDKKLKQNLFYNMGNCAVQLKRYSLAKRYYQKSLILGEEKDALFNLKLLYALSLKEQKNLSKMLPKKENSAKKKHQDAQKKSSKSKKSSASNSKANQLASQKSAGSGANKKKNKKLQESLKLTKKENKSKYKLGYKAYELINKGYTNEIHPW